MGDAETMAYRFGKLHRPKMSLIALAKETSLTSLNDNFANTDMVDISLATTL